MDCLHPHTTWLCIRRNTASWAEQSTSQTHFLPRTHFVFFMFPIKIRQRHIQLRAHYWFIFCERNNYRSLRSIKWLTLLQLTWLHWRRQWTNTHRKLLWSELMLTCWKVASPMGDTRPNEGTSSFGCLCEAKLLVIFYPALCVARRASLCLANCKLNYWPCAVRRDFVIFFQLFF